MLAEASTLDWMYLGNLYHVLNPAVASPLLIFCSTLCGMIVGLERKAARKAAGGRTIALICIGSTIFTMCSMLLGTGEHNDPGRIAAQVVTGVGFLGAGAIFRTRGTVVGLTTAATIWAVAAIGILVGIGYGFAGVLLAILIVLLLRFHPDKDIFREK